MNEAQEKRLVRKLVAQALRREIEREFKKPEWQAQINSYIRTQTPYIVSRTDLFQEAIERGLRQIAAKTAEEWLLGITLEIKEKSSFPLPSSRSRRHNDGGGPGSKSSRQKYPGP